MATEYRTTIGNYATMGRDLDGELQEASADDPEDPHPAEGWILVGSAAADGLLFWFWKREVP